MEGIYMDIKKISPQEAKKQIEMDNDIVLLDVRSEKEYNEVHIKNSILVPLGDIIREIEQVLPDKQSKIFTYCHSGARSARAAKLLKLKGYSNIYDLGGIIDWPYEVQKEK
jgi:rhodanese-related sulfurtransferase